MSAGTLASMRAVRPALVITCLLTLWGAGCGDDNTGDTTVAGLAGKTFESTSVDGHPLVAGTNVTMSFDEDGVAVSAGCNTLRGAIAIQSGTLQVGTMAQTMMACTDDLTAQDTFLAQFLTSGPTIELDGRTLTLSGPDATITADVTSG